MSDDTVAQDMPLDAFIREMEECGFEWVKRIGHVNVHIFEHRITHEVRPVPVERDVVRAIYVADAQRDAANFATTRDRPFDPKVVEQAEVLAASYKIDVGEDSAGFVGVVRDMPSVIGHGTSRDAALDLTRDLLKWAVAYLIETGRTPAPRP